jgi:hypothetical protein
VEDSVVSAEQIASMMEGQLPTLREAGLDDATIADLLQPRGLSTFETTTFHPRCNEPVAAAALRVTHGSL